MFYGQIVWTEITDNMWAPVEIVPQHHMYGKAVASQSMSALLVRVIETGEYRNVDHCELITFTIGESVLKGLMIDNREGMSCL